MTALRYLFALPKQRRDNGEERIRRVGDPEDVAAHAPAVWCSDDRQSLSSTDDRTVVLGRLFDRNHAHPVSLLADVLTREPSPSPVRLMDSYWGGYIALFSDRPQFRALRDPTGLMPAYRLDHGDNVLLSSDIDTLVSAGASPSVDWERLYEYLREPGVRRVATCLSQISELMPGSLIDLRGNGAAEQLLWTPWRFAGPESRITSADAADEVRDAVCKSVAALAGECHNIVVSLSGGLDSSIVCAALASVGQPFTALTMYTADRSGDERVYAGLVADRTGARLLEHRFDEERIDLSRSISRHLPRPVGRTFMQEIERAFREEIQSHGFDAIFTGNGGDNVFCYLHSAAPIVDRLRSSGKRGGLAATFVDMCHITQCDITTMVSATISLLTRRRRRAATPDMRFLDVGRTSSEPSSVLTPYLDEAGGLPGKRAHIDLLMKIQNHVEGYDRHRMPPVVPVLLAQPVVETCLRIASWDWCRGGVNRAVAREAFGASLPDQIVSRRSKAGPESLTAAVFELGRSALRELLLGGLLRDNRIIDAAAIETALNDPAITRGQDLFRIMELTEAEAWARSWTGDGRRDTGHSGGRAR